MPDVDCTIRWKGMKQGAAFGLKSSPSNATYMIVIFPGHRDKGLNFNGVPSHQLLGDVEVESSSGSDPEVEAFGGVGG